MARESEQCKQCGRERGERERQEEKEGEERQGRQCETKSSQGRQTVRDDTDYLREQSDAIVLFEPIRLSRSHLMYVELVMYVMYACFHACLHACM